MSNLLWAPTPGPVGSAVVTADGFSTVASGFYWRDGAVGPVDGVTAWMSQEVTGSAGCTKTGVTRSLLGSSFLFQVNRLPTASTALMQAVTASGSPSWTWWLQTDGTLRFRDQTTNDTAFPVKVDTGKVVRLDALTDLTNTSAKVVHGRFWPDYLADPYAYQEASANLSVNAQASVESVRFGHNVGQSSLLGDQWADIGLWDDWPPVPVGTPRIARVWDGLAWQEPTAGAVLWDGLAWVPVTEALYWDGFQWQPVGLP